MRLSEERAVQAEVQTQVPGPQSPRWRWVVLRVERKPVFPAQKGQGREYRESRSETKWKKRGCRTWEVIEGLGCLL